MNENVVIKNDLWENNKKILRCILFMYLQIDWKDIYTYIYMVHIQHIITQSAKKKGET